MIQQYIFLFALLFSLSCNKTDDDDAIEPVMDDTCITPSDKSMTFLALGDSYTIGQSVPVDKRWPVQLASQLRCDSIDVAEPMIIAQTGWRTDNLDLAIDNADIEDSTFSMVSLLIGVNDQYQNKPISNYKPAFTALLQRAIGFAGGDKSRVFVVSIPDYGYTPFGASNQQNTSNELDQYNAINKSVSDSLGVSYYNITPISRQDPKDKSLVAPDNLHPSGEQYRQWVELMYEGIKAQLAM